MASYSSKCSALPIRFVSVEAGRGNRLPVVAGGPWVLAIETATRVLSVAVLRGERVVAEFSSEGLRVHSERLLPAIDRVLAEAGRSLSELDALAVSAGPGSFTGVRIGIATLKGLAFAEGRAAVPVSTLAALRLAAAGAPGPVASLLDARRGELYAGAWHGAGPEAEPLWPESVLTPEALAERLPEGSTLVVGEDAATGAEAVLAARPGAFARVGAPEVAARAHWIGELAQRALAAGRTMAPETLLPSYLRRAEAEVKRTGEAFEAAPGRSS